MAVEFTATPQGWVFVAKLELPKLPFAYAPVVALKNVTVFEPLLVTYRRFVEGFAATCIGFDPVVKLEFEKVPVPTVATAEVVVPEVVVVPVLVVDPESMTELGSRIFTSRSRADMFSEVSNGLGTTFKQEIQTIENDRIINFINVSSSLMSEI